MKKVFWACSLGVFLTALCGLAADRGARWKEVDDAVNKGLPQSAIAALEPVIKEALAEKAYPEAVKAIVRKIVLEGNIQGNKPEEKITRLQSVIATAPRETVPILDTILAEWYWHYFQNNRWRFMQRKATAASPGKDFPTWDVPRLFAEIDRQFQKALAAAETLKKIPVAAYDQLLPRGSLPDKYRPTLYDFIAHEALAFYTAGEQAAALPQDAFEVSADSDVLGPAEKFLDWKPVTTDADSPKLKAFILYQNLLRFHQPDNDPSAFVDADIGRLVYANNVAFGEDKAARFKSAMKALAEKWADHELSALALHHWARTVHQEGNLIEARSIAQRGAKAFPGSPGGKFCINLVAEIEAKSANIVTERVWNAPWPKIEVHYRNVTNVYFRAVADDWDELVKLRSSDPAGNLDPKRREELLKKKPALEWSSPLPSTPDYKEHTEFLPAPENLKPGFYFIIAGHEPGFGEKDNQVSLTDVWVSDLAFIVRTRLGEREGVKVDPNTGLPSKPGQINGVKLDPNTGLPASSGKPLNITYQDYLDGFVLDAKSGEPLPGAEVLSWTLDNQNRRTARPKLLTDENGFFSFIATNNVRYVLHARHHGQELGSLQDYSTSYDQFADADRVFFFTDRAIYRPGQTIQYKGIAVKTDERQDDYQLLAGREINVIFTDPNGKEITRQKQRCNDYGSFAGSFVAPRDRLMGSMQIRAEDVPIGSTQISVEEYKRPKFQVTLDAPQVAPRLNEKVSLQGHALSYTGAAVDGAQVRYRIAREVRWPYWRGWYSGRSFRQQQSQEIAHGKINTEPDGSFKIEFVAKPDPTAPEKDEPTFSFQIDADVTDGSGETRSAQRGVHVGYTALQATLNAEDWQTEDKPVEITINTQTLDGVGQTAEGALKIYRLKEPSQVQRPSLRSDYPPRWGADSTEQKEDLSNPNSWPLGDLVAETGFTTDVKGETKKEFKLGVGVYRAMLETQDRFGKKVTARLPLRVLKPGDTRFAIKIPHLLDAPTWSVEPGRDLRALWGTGYDAGRAFIEIEHRHKMIQRYWTRPGETQAVIKQTVTDAMRGGFTLHVTWVRENRAYLDSQHVEVPWNNKHLDLKWEHFTSKLQPSQKETWMAVITGSDAQKAAVEMVATLYDQSLDAFLPLHWQHRFDFFRQDFSSASATFANTVKNFSHVKGNWAQSYVPVDLRYRMFPADLIANYWGYQFMRGGLGGGGGFGGGGLRSAAPGAQGGSPPMEVMALSAAPAANGAMMGDANSLGAKLDKSTGIGGGEPSSAGKGPDLNLVSARKNLSETAFFFPQLLADSNGVVRMQFTMPEALTQWKFMGFAHDKAARSGFLEGEAITAKDLMVQPNPPRFLREGDALEFTVKVSNRTATRQAGKVRLTFDDAERRAGVPPAPAGVTPAKSKSGTGQGQAGRLPYVDGTAIDSLLDNTTPEIAFDIPAKESRSFAWKIKVPDGTGFLTYKAVGSTGRVSDGEEGFLPVLPRRILITESLPLPIRGPATKKFEFKKLLASGKSNTLRHQNLVVQMVSNPGWYAVLALPYLMEFPHECTEQTFNRLYANALARFIASSDPKIQRVFEHWRNTPALDTPLEKNQDLKSVMLEETPWLRQAVSESQARKNVGVLFEENRLNYEVAINLRKLAEMQLGDGAWPWFPGGPGNDYITLYITTGFGRLRHLGVDIAVDPAVRSLNRLDGWIDRTYREIVKHGNKEENHLSETIALYLYGRSFFLKDQPIPANAREAVDYFSGQARKYWLKLANRQSQGHLAIALKRFNSANLFNDATVPSAIMKSIKERSVTDEEMGMFWRDSELSWWWYRAPIETQALMIEAFDEVAGDAPAVEACKVWLLKQKQTQDWKTTKATADAVYALLLRGHDLLASDALVEVSLGGVGVTPKQGRAGVSPGPEDRRDARPTLEPGTGFYEKRFAVSDIKPTLGEITVKKVDSGVAWGSVSWQYLEDMSKVAPYEGTPLKLKKTLYTKTHTKKGPVIEPLKGAANVGDELVVRIELRVDRDMEYVHLKDQRGSGTEPLNVLSGYRYQDGLAYYESTRDTASHFFIDYVPKGVYVFEYSTRVQHRGQYQTGVAEIECMYAPEFNSHSESIRLEVK